MTRPGGYPVGRSAGDIEGIDVDGLDAGEPGRGKRHWHGKDWRLQPGCQTTPFALKEHWLFASVTFCPGVAQVGETIAVRVSSIRLMPRPGIKTT